MKGQIKSGTGGAHQRGASGVFVIIAESGSLKTQPGGTGEPFVCGSVRHTFHREA
jgi:hypothetical protein